MSKNRVTKIKVVISASFLRKNLVQSVNCIFQSESIKNVQQISSKHKRKTKGSVFFSIRKKPNHCFRSIFSSKTVHCHQIFLIIYSCLLQCIKLPLLVFMLKVRGKRIPGSCSVPQQCVACRILVCDDMHRSSLFCVMQE